MEFRAEQFSIEFEHEKKWYPAVTDLNMHIDAGEMVALIGESGCGKSITRAYTKRVDEASRKRDFNDFSGADDGTQSTD